MEERTRLTRESFDNLTPIVSPAVIPTPERVWSSDDWAQLGLGHGAAEMEDKWLAFVDDDRLFLHRSWTGRGIYEARFMKREMGWCVVEALVESNPSAYGRQSDETETMCLELTIESVLLGRYHEHEWKRWAERFEASDNRDSSFDLLLHHLIGNRWGHATSTDHIDGDPSSSH